MAYSGYVVIDRKDEIYMVNRPDFNSFMCFDGSRGYLVRNDIVEFYYEPSENGPNFGRMKDIPGEDLAWLIMLGFQIRPLNDVKPQDKSV